LINPILYPHFFPHWMVGNSTPEGTDSAGWRERKWWSYWRWSRTRVAMQLVYICIHICIHICRHNIHIHIHIWLYLYAYIYIYKYIYIFIKIYLYLYIYYL
jgi:hypothetical protein